MINKLTLSSVLLLMAMRTNCQIGDEYQVYALKYTGSSVRPAQIYITEAKKTDSVRFCGMVWLLKGENGKNILVDAGTLDTSKTRNKNHIRPDLLLQTINVYPSDITDIIITHTHNDHVGGINLFPKATVWIQKEEFEYFAGP